MTGSVRAFALGTVALLLTACTSTGPGLDAPPIVVPASATTGENSSFLWADVRERFPDTFTAAIWDGGTSTVRLLMVPESMEGAAELARAEPHPFTVRVEPARFSDEALSAALSRITESDDPILDLDYSGGPVSEDQTIAIAVDERSPELLRVLNELADPVQVVWSDGPPAVAY